MSLPPPTRMGWWVRSQVQMSMGLWFNCLAETYQKIVLYNAAAAAFAVGVLCVCFHFPFANDPWIKFHLLPT